MGEASRPVPGLFRLFGVHQKNKTGAGVESLDKRTKTMRRWPQAPGTVFPQLVHSVILPDARAILKTDPNSQFESYTGKTEFRFANISIFRPSGFVR